jgi:glycosyltransferase involved in cell wall biosynthesis
MRANSKILWANFYCLLDTTSGASQSVNQMLIELSKRNFLIEVVGCTVFDNEIGLEKLKKTYSNDFSAEYIEVTNKGLTHRLVKTDSTQRGRMTSDEINRFYQLYCAALDQFKPDLVMFYGGSAADFLIPHEARVRGIPAAFYLVNENYKGTRWLRDVDIVLTDTKATSDLYYKSFNFRAEPIGKFIDIEKAVATEHQRKHLTFINPSWIKGAGFVAMLAILMEKIRPDITFEVVESRGSWNEVLGTISHGLLGRKLAALENVIVSPNTDQISEIYSRSRVVLFPSLWFESGSRVLTEAMLNGIPTIITPRGGNVEITGNAGIEINLPDSSYEFPYNSLPHPKFFDEIIHVISRLWDDDDFYLGFVARAVKVGYSNHRPEVSTQRLIDVLKPIFKAKASQIDFVDAIFSESKHQLIEKITPMPYQPYQRFKESNPSTALINPSFLIENEIKYGGLHNGVKRTETSKFEDRQSYQLTHGHIGGDRMHTSHHGYAAIYSMYINRLLTSKNTLSRHVIAEVGILKGLGLATWCDIFSESRVLGFDLDPTIYNAHKPTLKKLGAFKNNSGHITRR